MSKIIRLGPTSDNVTYYLPVELPDVFALHSNEIVLYCIKCDPETHKIPEYLCNLKTRFINAPLDQLWGWYSDPNSTSKNLDRKSHIQVYSLMAVDHRGSYA